MELIRLDVHGRLLNGVQEGYVRVNDGNRLSIFFSPIIPGSRLCRILRSHGRGWGWKSMLEGERGRKLFSFFIFF